MAMFFLGMYLHKNETFFADIIRILLQDQSNTSQVVPQLEFFQKTTVLHVSAVFTAKDGQEMVILWKFCWRILNFKFKEVQHTLLIKPIKRQHGSACQCVLARCVVQSSEILVALWPTVSCCLATSVVWSRQGPRGLPSPKIFKVLGGMKVAFIPSPSLGPWGARHLDGANVDSRVWLASTRNYIAFVVLFMV